MTYLKLPVLAQTIIPEYKYCFFEQLSQKKSPEGASWLIHSAWYEFGHDSQHIKFPPKKYKREFVKTLVQKFI